MATQSVTGIATTTKNVCIPIQNANVGDAIAIKSDATGESISDFIAVVGSSVQATAPSGYAWYGSVYGREKRGLMIRSFTPASAKWASTTEGGVTVTLDATNHKNVLATSIDSGGLIRNGLSSYNGRYVCMSVGEIISRNSSSTTTHLHPNSPYNGNGNYPMGKANFDADTNGAKTMYGTYENYIAQLLPIMKGSMSGVFSKRCGKQNTKELALNNSTNGYSFPAASYCYTFKVGSENANHWWLPDMYELAVMMSDASFEKCQYVHSVIGGNTSRASYRWSCVRFGSTYAWYFSYSGFSSANSFYNGFTVCPVTLLNL